MTGHRGRLHTLMFERVTVTVLYPLMYYLSVSSFHEIKMLFYVKYGPIRVKETIKQVKLTELQLQRVTAFWQKASTVTNQNWHVPVVKRVTFRV